MIVRPKYNWFRMLFVWRGSVLPALIPRLIPLFLLSCLIVALQGQVFLHKIPLTPAPFTLIGIALAIFLGFRNNASYERFWEGRKLWGSLLIDSRSLARQAITMSGLPADSPQTAQFVNLLIAFAYALKHQLRQTSPAADLERLLPAPLAETLQSVRFKPVRLLVELGKWVQQGQHDGRIDTPTSLAFDQNLNLLSGVVGGCERIANTPIPYTYSVLMHRTVYIYCFLLPFGLVDSIGWMTPLIVVFIGYTFIALEAIGNEIEEPFGVEPNDLALNQMCRTVEVSLLEMIGKTAPVIAEKPDPAFVD
ncbi:bestrophin family protein [Larkinella ripae]